MKLVEKLFTKKPILSWYLDDKEGNMFVFSDPDNALISVTLKEEDMRTSIQTGTLKLENCRIDATMQDFLNRNQRVKKFKKYMAQATEFSNKHGFSPLHLSKKKPELSDRTKYLIEQADRKRGIKKHNAS